MRDLTFFTTNSMKLSQSRYIAEDFKVKVKGFRQRTYHAGYFEPRLSDRFQILEQSYRSAIEQCDKAGLSIDSHAFFLEDTSVRIDAFSTDENEVPGVDVKYWMKNQTFAELDSQLRSFSNNRRVTVRSDILLHVPRSLRSLWGVDDDYIVFVGEQSGCLVSEEVDYSPNAVYPWLDDKTFNKWFVPDGRLLPLGALNIDSARSVDFRVKSLCKMFEFLQNKRYFSPDPVQMKLDLDVGENLVFCGYTCAGKTVASQYLALHYGYSHVEASDFMHLSYLYRHGYNGPIAIGDFAEAALAQKPEIAAEQVVEYIKRQPHLPTVVSGFRSPAEVIYLQNAFAEQGRHFKIVFVDSDEAVRFRRINERQRPGDNISFDKFRSRDAQQRRMGLETIRNNSETVVITNEGGVDHFKACVSSLAGDATANPIDIPKSYEKLSALKDVKLEDAILIALLSKWEASETRPFFSTTEICRLLNLIFSGSIPKHKDNVSRYFNQDFYSFYEISGDSKNGRRYRLSNTGYGCAVRALRDMLFVRRNLHSID